MTEYGVVLFFTTSAALKAESSLKKAGFKVRLIPVPRQFSSDCGLALRFGWPDADAVQEELGRVKLSLAGVHALE